MAGRGYTPHNNAVRPDAHLGDVPEILVPFPLVKLDLGGLQVSPYFLGAVGEFLAQSRFR